MILLLLFSIVAVSYAALILWFTAGWMRLPGFWHQNNTGVSFSVIVPARNEEKHIMQLLILLRNQHYPKEKYEVIVVDDHSADATAHIVERKIASGFLKNVCLLKAAQLNGKTGKKNALTLGIESAVNPWIVTIDADCIAGSHWLQSLAGYIEEQQPAMVIGPVAVAPGMSLFSQFQALEFMSLAGSTAGSAAIGKPIMCNGANLAFRKEYFEKTGGFKGNENISSGDDMFLLHKFKKMPAAKISFLKSHGAIVYTRAVENPGGFFRQRGRWAGKAPSYRDGFTLFSAGLAGLMNLLVAVGLIAGLILKGPLLAYSLLLLLFKMLVDLPMLWSLTGYYRRRDLMWLYPALSLLYPFYVVASLVTGFVLKPRWK